MRVPFLDLKREYSSIKKEISKRILIALEKGEYCYGQETEKFERAFAHFIGCQYGIGVGSGTDALMISLRALGVGKGDEVITTPFTFIATAEAIVNIGARPVFVDIEEETMNMDINKIGKALTKKTKAIIAVHLYGVCLDMDPLFKIAKEHHLSVIEDAAHAEGSLYKGKPAGSLGDVGCFSLYPSKTFGAYGNAGIIVTNKKNLAPKLKMVSNHGRWHDKNVHKVIGFTGTIDNLQAAVLNVKLKYLKKRLEQKRKIAAEYNRALTKLSWLEIQEVPDFCEPSFYVYTIRTKEKEELKKFLSQNGIDTGVYYPYSLHFQPSLEFLGYKKGDFPVAERTAASVLSLPLYPEMSKIEVQYVIQKIKKFGEGLFS